MTQGKINLKKLYTEFPLFIAIVITSFIFGVIGLVGRGGIFSEYDYSFMDDPAITLFFKGVSEYKFFSYTPESEGFGSDEETASDEGLDLQFGNMGVGEYIEIKNGDSSEDADTNDHYNNIVGPGVNNESGVLNNPEFDEMLSHKYGRIKLLFSPESGISPSEYFSTLSANENNFITVGDEYFDDALFIGDSRVVGLSAYVPNLDSRATFYAQTSMSTIGLITKEVAQIDEEMYTLEDAFKLKSFNKIYVSVGVNELGSASAETFLENYKALVDLIKASYPNAYIYVCSIMHVSADVSQEREHVNNNIINERNVAISSLADNEKIFYLDMNEYVDDDEGNLREELTGDGIHLKAVSYEIWYDYLKEHAIEY